MFDPGLLRRIPAPIAIALAALVVGALVFVLLWRTPIGQPEEDSNTARTGQAGPPAILPPLPSPVPAVLIDVAPEDARQINAAVPFAKGPIPAAAPLRLGTTGEDRSRAIDCLAAALFYEAGDDPPGQAAVAQVVINRLRHPAFPKSVCAVVFQGAERSTGCQFTFTCDGALTRYRPSGAAWNRARAVAEAALAGKVFKGVGLATHYHTDWVVPYWSASLDKISAVGTHLFFRWQGFWGTRPAFRGGPTATEPVVTQLAYFSSAHASGAKLALSDGIPLDDMVTSPPTSDDPVVAPLPGNPSVFLARLATDLADRYPAIAQRSCKEMGNCRFFVWSDGAQAVTTLPLSKQQLADMTFSYVRDRNSGFERTLWNCAQFPSRSPCTAATASAKSGAAQPAPGAAAAPASVAPKSDATNG